MSDTPDDAYKDLMDIIHKIIVGRISPDKNQMPPVVGVEFVLNGGTIHLAPDEMAKKTIPIEMFEDETTITIQTQLPSECQNDFFIAYQDGKLQLKAGNKREYSAVIPVSEINPSLTQTHLKNGVLEIICHKKPAETPAQ